MIDVEDKLFSEIAPIIREEFDASVSNVLGRWPSSFPHVLITEIDNYVPHRMVDSSGAERFAYVAFQVEVYSNKRDTGPSECRKISAWIRDLLFEQYGLRAESTSPVQYLEDATVYLRTSRYVGVTDGTLSFYGR